MYYGGFLRYDRKKKVPVVGLAGVSVFGSGKKLAVFLLWRESFITTGKKKIQSSVWRVHDHYYDRKKKDTVVCLVGARSLLQPEKKKIQSSVWRVVLLYQFLVLAGN